ncbi:MAG: YIEGIA family protein [Candidatus Alkaliphilus sp. MAG34]
MNKHYVLIVPGLIMGTFARVHMMKSDYRQYPTYPRGYLSHFTLGFIAAGLGAVAVPALIEKEFTAITFLALAAQQFREVRNMERESLDNIEITEMVPRGTAYIEDIAKTFEARNYMAIITALVTSTIIHVFIILKINMHMSIFLGMFVGLAVHIFIKRMIHGEEISDIADVKEAKISFDGPILKVNGIVITNIGLQTQRDIFLSNGLAVEIIPKDENAVMYLSNMGQRQAIQHNAANQLGVRRDFDEPEFTPVAKRDPENGNIVMVITIMKPNIDALIEAVKGTPLLETSKRKPLDSVVGLRLMKNRKKV